VEWLSQISLKEHLEEKLEFTSFRNYFLSSSKCNHGKRSPTRRIFNKQLSWSKKVYYLTFLICLRMTLLVSAFPF
jgi:hypothetical protein